MKIIRIYVINNNKIEITDESNNSIEVNGNVLDLTLKECIDFLEDED